MRRIWMLAPFLLSAGCIFREPTTREEFVQDVRRHPSLCAVDTQRISRPFEAVLATLTEKEPCLAVGWTSSGRHGPEFYYSQGGYVPLLEKKGPDAAEFTLRMWSSPRSVGAPKDGMFFVAIDLARNGSGAIATTYHSKHGIPRPIADTLEAWMEGRDAPCPKLVP